MVVERIQPPNRYPKLRSEGSKNIFKDSERDYTWSNRREGGGIIHKIHFR